MTALPESTPPSDEKRTGDYDGDIAAAWDEAGTLGEKRTACPECDGNGWTPPVVGNNPGNRVPCLYCRTTGTVAASGRPQGGVT